MHVLYTGDYSMEDDRHLMAAEMPSTSPDVLIVEATYGVQVRCRGGEWGVDGMVLRSRM